MLKHRDINSPLSVGLLFLLQVRKINTLLSLGNIRKTKNSNLLEAEAAF